MFSYPSYYESVFIPRIAITIFSYQVYPHQTPSRTPITDGRPTFIVLIVPSNLFLYTTLQSSID
jgi:hypothetical protein